MSFSPLAPLLTDFYKVDHNRQYPDNTEEVYSNMTPRSSHLAEVPGNPYNDRVVVFGLQAMVKDLLIDRWNETFFGMPAATVERQYRRRMDNALGAGAVPTANIMELHELGKLPLVVKALPEGSLCPIRVPFMTMRNTDKRFSWLTNSLETIISNMVWKPVTSATTAHRYRKVFDRYAVETGADRAFVDWQGHDFAFRGLNGWWDAASSGAGHLLSFTGTDTIPAIDFLEHFYGADSDKELVGGSVYATEHSVMCMGQKGNEFETFKRLITTVYPKGVVSIVSDTWDYWAVLQNFLPRLKKDILNRDGKLVIRPDSGDPEKIICGDPLASVGTPANKGSIQLLWELFSGKINDKGFRVLDPHIGLIYGDSITLSRQAAILQSLKNKGFCSSNVVFGVGSFSYQFVTRDNYGQAVKATSGVVNGQRQAVSKDPKTDNGTKKSAVGLLRVERTESSYELFQNQTEQEETGGALATIFRDGMAENFQTLAGIRARLAAERTNV